jgi:protein TonB
MSYADADGGRRFNPTGLAATMLINGAMILGVASFVPQAGEAVIDWFPKPFVPTPEAPTPPPEAQKSEKQDIKETTEPRQLVPSSPPAATSGAQGTNTLDTGTIVDYVAPPIPPVGGMGEVIKKSDPPITVPIRIGAKVDPRYASALQPDYPPALARNEIEGTATVRVLIGPDGRVKQVEKVRATEDGFFEATRRQALAKWRFKPATEDGKPVEAWREMTVRFELKT